MESIYDSNILEGRRDVHHGAYSVLVYNVLLNLQYTLIINELTQKNTANIYEILELNLSNLLKKYIYTKIFKGKK